MEVVVETAIAQLHYEDCCCLMDLAEKSVRLAVDLGVEYADVRTEQNSSTVIRLTNDRFEQAVSGVDKGLGVRVSG